MKNLWLPRTVLEADFLVPMPKIKTHHWSGVTLCMKTCLALSPGHDTAGRRIYPPL